MTPSWDDADRLQRLAEAQELDRLEQRVGGAARRTLMRKFELSEEDADTVVRKTLVLAIFAPSGEREAWVIGAACAAARALQRSRGLASTAPAAPPDATPKELDALARIVVTAEALAGLPERGREALRLRLFEQQSYPAIGAELSVSSHYARTLVTNALERLLAASRRDPEQES